MVNLRAFYAREVIGYVLGTVIRRRYLISGIRYSDNIKITTKEDFDMFDGYDMMKKMKADNEVD